jgi:hypothetical protein
MADLVSAQQVQSAIVFDNKQAVDGKESVPQCRLLDNSFTHTVR